jgi:hypothetical protein
VFHFNKEFINISNSFSIMIFNSSFFNHFSNNFNISSNLFSSINVSNKKSSLLINPHHLQNKFISEKIIFNINIFLFLSKVKMYSYIQLFENLLNSVHEISFFILFSINTFRSSFLLGNLLIVLFEEIIDSIIFK